MHRLHFLYHELRDEGSDYSYVVKSSEFADHMELFRALHVEGRNACVPEVTFDDGHASNFSVALPILQEHGLQAHFFITVGWTGVRESYMGWPELRALHAAGQKIGAHGWTHTLLTHCDAKQLQVELRDARLKLEDELSTAVTTMSLPGGRYNRGVLVACREAGYTQVYTSIPRAETAADEFMVGRLNVVGGTSLTWMNKVLDPTSGVLAGLERQYKIKGLAKSVLGDGLYARLWSLVNRSEPQAGDEA